MMIRAYAGGESSREFQDLVSESITVRMMLQHHGMTMPGESTINDNAGAVTNRTRRMIHRLQVRYARAEGLDDFAEMTVDSTSVEADSSWPTDSTVILKLTDRIWRIGSDLEQYETEKGPQSGVELGGQRSDWRQSQRRLRRKMRIGPWNVTLLGDMMLKSTVFNLAATNTAIPKP